MGIRDQFRVMIGGGPVTQAYAEEVGADAYGRDAIKALEVAKEVLA
jgi:methanogenic corrinoid protein MtbC1